MTDDPQPADLRCTACGKRICQFELEAFRHAGTYRCCLAMDLQPVRAPPRHRATLSKAGRGR